MGRYAYVVVIHVPGLDRGASGVALAMAVASGGQEACVAAGRGHRGRFGFDDVVGSPTGGEARAGTRSRTRARS